MEMEELRVELRKKEEDLLLAAGLGKKLLEENNLMKGEIQSLRDECRRYQEMMQSQKNEAQRSLSEVRYTAESRITELEEQLANLEQTIVQERSAAISATDEQKKMLENLRMDNANLQHELQVTKEKETRLRLETKRQLETCDEEKLRLGQETADMQKQLQTSQEDNKILVEEVSTLTHACDKFTDELENVREKCEYWENCCISKDEELKTQMNELSDSQALASHLQLQLDQQGVIVLTPASSGMSLFDELATAPDQLSGSTCSDTYEEYLERSRTPSSEIMESSSDVVSPEKAEDAIQGWEEVYQCQRCCQLKEELQKQNTELQFVNEQLMIAVKQKIELHEQIEAWQADMAVVVDKQVHKKLKKDIVVNSKKRGVDKKEKKTTASHSHSWFMG